ncbi:MAG: prepilin-type N-terminal cleavage/methylation domain-containing protein [Deltaproteobacteria bacterium]|jgi:prepilin-type N-terminal cleavage/methylation domain-containing protein|nr:prepilin-type N-terminal cleavage/methylation domain-containing protein [Deltaproteobacteria bacterium]
MKSTLNTHRGGFTLVEILVVMAMIGVVMGAVYSLYITNMRTAYTSDNTVEVQQNLRIAMDVVTRDLRMAGMLVDYGNNIFPIQTTINDQVPALPLTIPTDGITTNMASATATYAKINADITPAGTPAAFPIAPATRRTLSAVDDADALQAGDGDVLQVSDVVRIIRPLQNTQPAVTSPATDATFTVTAVVRQVKLVGETGYVAPTVTLTDAAGATMAGIEFKRGDMIAKVNATDAATPSPNTVQYAVVTFAAAPATATTDPNCPIGQRCLARRLNNETAAGNPVWQIVAQNIANFQLRYLMDDDDKSVSDAPSDRSLIKGVMVAITGETASMTGSVPKTRQLTSVVKLRNRRL